MSVSTKDKKVQDLLALVELQKQKISKAENPSWVTNCSFGFTEDSANRTNIVTVNSPEKLIGMLAFLIGKEKEYNSAAELLGVKSDFRWLGYSVEDWTADFKARITKININSERLKLETLEKRLNSLVSPELRAEIELAEIERMLG